MKAAEFVARIDPNLLRTRPLNAGRSRLGGNPFFVTTQQYDRSSDVDRMREVVTFSSADSSRN